MKPQLYVGNCNYSSWSLRPWLALRWAGIDFDETAIDLDQPGYGEGRIAAIRAVSPSGKVPALRIGEAVIWESIAIAEWAAENSRTGPLLPEHPVLRAQARAVVAEMHAGFGALRRDLPMNIRRRCHATGLPAETHTDIARVDAMWTQLRQQHAAQGPYLFGRRSLADALYLPVATRFRTYGIELSPTAQTYCDMALADPAFREWEARALAEPAKPFSRARTDSLYPDGNGDPHVQR
jgi:glutathione S-transferase